jgi:predicted Rossmann fold nucleotide-binding protein DprA/Smf involved in DNA uptake
MMQNALAAKLQMIGNAAILDRPDKVAFLLSRRISPADVLQCYEWAEKVRDTEQCVVSGFQSPLEKDVLKFLLRGKVPVILVLARSLWKTVPEELREPVGQGRLLIVSPVAATRASSATAAARNRWILTNCTSLVLGSLDPNGNLARLVASFPRNHITCLQDIPSGQENL